MKSDKLIITIRKYSKSLKYTWLGFALNLVFIVFGLVNGSRIVFRLYPYIIGLSGLFMLYAFSKKIFTKKWYEAIFQFSAGLFVLFVFFFMFYPNDLLFSHLDIPNDIEYETPIHFTTKSETDNFINSIDKKGKFKISGGSGNYRIYFWKRMNKKGVFYLKAFDAVGNIELSKYRLKDRTEMRVNDFELNQYIKDFTIYDGVWDCMYIGRIELWFKPDSNEKDYKVDEQNYIIDGWIR